MPEQTLCSYFSGVAEARRLDMATVRRADRQSHGLVVEVGRTWLTISPL